MRDWVKRYEVENLSKIDTTLYLEGDIFYTKQSIGILHNGKVRTFKAPDVSDFVTKSEVQSMIDNAISKGGGA